MRALKELSTTIKKILTKKAINMKHLEFKLQQRVCKYLKITYPEVRFLSDAISNVKLTIPQQRRNKSIQDDRFKCPDLLILKPSGSYCGLFIELKTSTPFRRDGKIKSSSKDHLKKQLQSINELLDAGYHASFQWDYDTIVTLIDSYLLDHLLD